MKIIASTTQASTEKPARHIVTARIICNEDAEDYIRAHFKRDGESDVFGMYGMPIDTGLGLLWWRSDKYTLDEGKAFLADLPSKFEIPIRGYSCKPWVPDPTFSVYEILL
jgi:hypothetical protein